MGRKSFFQNLEGVDGWQETKNYLIMVNIMDRPSGVLFSSDKQNFDFWFWKLCCLSTGYGIFTKRGLRKGGALLEYKGDIVSSKIAELQRKPYAKERKGCFIYDVERKGDVIW